MPDDDTAERPRLAVVVCTRDRAEMLTETLAALRATLGETDELIVVDSASRDPSAAQAPAARFGARLVRVERPGASRARNAGAAAARSDLIAFVDDDCSVADGWPSSIIAAMSDETLGFTTGAMLPDRSEGLPLSLVTGAVAQRFDREADPFALGSSGNVVIRRAALDQAGGWDEALGPATALCAAEDVDVLWRILHAGWVGAYEPSIAVTHRQWRSRREAMRVQLGYGIGAGGFIAKVLRVDRAVGRRILRHRLWTDGVLQAGRLLGNRWKTGAVAELVAVYGILVGLVRARRLRLDGTVYRSPR